MVVGRAGIGLDNVDVEAATAQGVMVVNAPQSNVLSAAEHTMALLLAQARNVPQAHAALKEGRWERSKWEGVELADKTLGIIGLGRIGKLVAQRALAFGMKLIAYDPFVAEDRARQLSVDLVDLETLFAPGRLRHPPPGQDQGDGRADRRRAAGQLQARAADHQRRPGRDHRRGRPGRRRRVRVVAGAALDVFTEEPTTESPLFSLDSVVVTPHLGASTREAQDKAGDTIADMVQLALAGDFVPFAVNVSAAEASETLRPFLPLAERLGRLYASLAGKLPSRSRSTYRGQLADYDTRILTLSVLKGVFGAVADQPVSYVNAPQLAEEAGRRGDVVGVGVVDRVREPGDGAGRRPRHRRHARRAPARAPDHDDRRPVGRPAAGPQPARRPQRRPARDDRRW